MIRILHSVSNMDRAGIETMLMNYYRHIDRSRVQFDFLCNKTKPGAYDEEIKALGGKILHTTGLNPFKYGKYLACMHQIIQDHPEYQIIHAHNGALAAYPLYSAMREGIKHRICHVHSASFTVDYKLPVKLFCKPFLPRCANHYWACGNAAAKFYYGERRVDAKETRVINNAIEIDKFVFNEKVRANLRTQYELNDKLVIGHAGRFMTQKNHAFLIDVFAQVIRKKTNSFLVLLGDGELFGQMQEKVKAMGIADSVLFLGNVSNVNEWYQAMDLFVMPSIWEGLPVVGIEAQTADLPCVFSDDITREVELLPNTKFMSRKLPAEQWADEILNMVPAQKRINRKKLIQDAGYDISVEAEKLMTLYEKMVNGDYVV